MKKIFICVFACLTLVCCLFVVHPKKASANSNEVYPYRDFSPSLLFYNSKLNCSLNDLQNVVDGDFNTFAWFDISNLGSQDKFIISLNTKNFGYFNSIVISSDLIGDDCFYGYSLYINGELTTRFVTDYHPNVRHYTFTFDEPIKADSVELRGLGAQTNWIKIYEFNVAFIPRSQYDFIFEDVYVNSFQNGYEQGLDEGYNNGYEQGLDEGYNNGYNYGYDLGLIRGQENGEKVNASFGEMILSILDAPRQAISNVLNFEFLGVNLSSLVFFLISCALVVAIVKFFL